MVSQFAMNKLMIDLPFQNHCTAPFSWVLPLLYEHSCNSRRQLAEDNTTSLSFENPCNFSP